MSSYRSLSADYIRPLCVDANPGFQRCNSGQLTFTTELTLNLGRPNGQTVSVHQYEQLYGWYTDYRPVYKAVVPDGSSFKFYLYHAYGRWRLGFDYTRSTFALTVVSDTAMRPEFITSDWQLYVNEGIWKRIPNLKLRCSGMLSSMLIRYSNKPVDRSVLACDSISAERAIMLSPVRPSVCHTGGSVKTVEVRIMQLSAQNNPIPIPLVFCHISSIQKF